MLTLRYTKQNTEKQMFFFIYLYLERLQHIKSMKEDGWGDKLITVPKTLNINRVICYMLSSLNKLTIDHGKHKYATM